TTTASVDLLVMMVIQGDHEDSLIIGNKELSTIPEKESDEFIKSSVEDFVPILKGNSVTFSNHLFDSNDYFTSSDDKSLSDEDVLEDNVKIYSNPFFKFDDEYNSSDVNTLFDEVFENIENKDSYLDELDLLVTLLSDTNEDEFLDPGGNVDEIERLLHHDLSSLKMSVASILEGFTDEPPLKENDDLFDLESKENKWKNIFTNLMTEDKVFDPRIQEKFFYPTYCQPRNQNYFEPNLCYNPNSYGFDQPTQTSIDHQPPKEMSVRELLLQKLHKALQAVCKKLNQQEHAANVSTHTPEPSRRFNFIYDDDDDDEESTIPLNEITYQIPLLLQSYPFYLLRILRTLSSWGMRILALFLKRNRTNDDESLSDEDVLEDNVKIYSNPLFVFDDDYISSDVNPFFDEVLEDIESKVSYDSNLDDPTLLLIPFSDSNEDEYSAPGDDIELLLHHDQSTPKMRVVSILEGFTEEPPFK
nr:hypothetical protein [Tanacetum cinerariifolium]